MHGPLLHMLDLSQAFTRILHGVRNDTKHAHLSHMTGRRDCLRRQYSTTAPLDVYNASWLFPDMEGALTAVLSDLSI